MSFICSASGRRLVGTHYPLFKKVLAQSLGSRVRLIDSAQATACKVAELLGVPSASDPDGKAQDGTTHFFVTDVPDRFCRVGGSFLNSDINGVQQIDIDR